MATFVEFLSTLLDAKEQTIVWHNQTTSYAEHKALDKFQDELAEKYDDLVESVSGIYGRPKNYSVVVPIPASSQPFKRRLKTRPKQLNPKPYVTRI